MTIFVPRAQPICPPTHEPAAILVGRPVPGRFPVAGPGVRPGRPLTASLGRRMLAEAQARADAEARRAAEAEEAEAADAPAVPFSMWGP